MFLFFFYLFITFCMYVVILQYLLWHMLLFIVKYTYFYVRNVGICLLCHLLLFFQSCLLSCPTSHCLPSLSPITQFFFKATSLSIVLFFVFGFSCILLLLLGLLTWFFRLFLICFPAFFLLTRPNLIKKTLKLYDLWAAYGSHKRKRPKSWFPLRKYN